MEIIERNDLLPGECIVLPGVIVLSARASPAQRRELLEGAGFVDSPPPISRPRFDWVTRRGAASSIGIAAMTAGVIVQWSGEVLAQVPLV